MTDRELLELAAKAAGITGHWSDFAPGIVGTGINSCDFPWNPLQSDTHALRLAVKLRLRFSSVCNAGDQAIASATDFDTSACIEDHKDDPYAATRRAIVRAAAEIGKGMK